MKCIACVLFSFAMLSCRAYDANEALHFTDRPYGEAPKATRIDAQEGDALEAKITVENFKELTIGQGSGLDGFDAIRIFSNGSGYGVFSHRRDRNAKAPITLSKQALDELIVALNADRITQIKGSYSAGLADGTQGFLEIKTTKGRRYCWLDNHFDPVSNTFAYCNKVIWPKLVGAKVEQKGIDRQAEYYRVFHPKSQNKRIQATGVPPLGDP